MNEREDRWFDDGDDVQLAEHWQPLEPTLALVSRGEEAVRRVVVEQQLGLVTEWLEMLRARPIESGLLVAAAAAALLMMTPLGTLWASLARLGA